jgi:DNA-binding GntR family transcriptional regulator
MSRTDYAYNQIKEWLLNGNLKPGETISSYKLAEVLNLSRTPVINALKKLESEGYIEVIPQVGCMVKLPNVDEARDRFMIRAVLEGFAAELAAQNKTDKDIE